jgi:GTPase SAR1 family protein
LKSWITSLNENTSVSLPKVVIANKLDLPDRVVSAYSIKQFQKENKVEIFECSAKLGKNINEAFECIIKEIIKNKQKQEDKLKIDTFENRDGSRCAC